MTEERIYITPPPNLKLEDLKDRTLAYLYNLIAGNPIIREDLETKAHTHHYHAENHRFKAAMLLLESYIQNQGSKLEAKAENTADVADEDAVDIDAIYTQLMREQSPED